MNNRSNPSAKTINTDKLDKIAVEARRVVEHRLKGHREQSLQIHPWVCGRYGQEFTHNNLHELTIHHKDHNHDNTPPDDSNWENLCLYCHSNEHQRYVDRIRRTSNRHSDTMLTQL